MRNSYQKIINSPLLSSLSFVLVILISNVYLFQSYFWHDDYDHLYRAQHNTPYGYPYVIFSRLTPLLYQLFGLNPVLYYAFSLSLVFVSAITLRYLLNQIFSNKEVSFLATLYFCIGYIGADSLLMTIGDGIGTLTMLPLVFLFLASYIKSIKAQKIASILTLSLFILILEFAPHRFSFLIAPTVLIDIYFSFFEKKRKTGMKQFLIRIIAIFAIWAIEMFIHPFASLLNYSVSIDSGTYQNLFINSIAFKNFSIYLGNIWNIFFPSMLFTSMASIFTGFLFLPSAVIFCISWFVCYKWQKILLLVGLLISVVLWINMGDAPYRYSAISGLFLLLFFISLLGQPKYRKTGFLVLSLLTLIFPFFLRSNEVYFESTNRYFMTLSFISSVLIAGIFVAFPKRKFLIVLFSIFCMATLICKIYSQRAFVFSYATHFKRIHTQLSHLIPPNLDKKLVYIEATTKELNFAATDAFRVGAQPSEAVMSVQLGGSYPQYLIAGTPTEISLKVSDNSVKIDNVYNFLYDGVTLRDRSIQTRNLLRNKQTPITIDVSDESKSDFIPSEEVSSLIPLQMILQRSEVAAFSYRVSWSYDSSGSLGSEFETVVAFPKGEKKMQFLIPGGGTYLKSIRVEKI